VPRVLALVFTAFAVFTSACLVVNDFDDLRGGAGGDGPVTAGAPNPPPDPCGGAFVRDACGPDQKCTLKSPNLGISGGVECGPSGSTPAWHACEIDADCADGAWCDRYSSACKPWCANFTECSEDASCSSARRLDGTPLPGVTVCTAHCNLELDTVCGPGLNCVIEDLRAPEGDCVKAGDVAAGCYCDPTKACIRGLRRDDADGVCKEWCIFGQPATCGGGSGCGSTIVTYGGTNFALCQDTEC